MYTYLYIHVYYISIYTYMYTYLYIHVYYISMYTYMYTYLCIHVYYISIYTYMYTYLYIHVYYISIYTYMYTYLYIHVYYISIYTYMYTYICIYIHVYYTSIYTYMYTYLYTCIYIYTYTRIHSIHCIHHIAMISPTEVLGMVQPPRFLVDHGNISIDILMTRLGLRWAEERPACGMAMHLQGQMCTKRQEFSSLTAMGQRSSKMVEAMVQKPT